MVRTEEIKIIPKTTENNDNNLWFHNINLNV
jgi:hypothetical protein